MYIQTFMIVITTRLYYNNSCNTHNDNNATNRDDTYMALGSKRAGRLEANARLEAKVQEASGPRHSSYVIISYNTILYHIMSYHSLA